MLQTPIFVDLPNFYSHLLESGLDEPRLLRDYFIDWFDFDRLAKKISGNYSTVWVFYSGHRFGPKPNRIEDKYLTDFINRIASSRGVTPRDVNIPGTQREPAKYTCDICKNEGVAQWESEKGIDSSITVHLFDTMDSWEVTYLLSGDADFVPIVSVLRRKGKIVIGAGFSSVASALVRECYDYLNLIQLYIKDDYLAYRLFKKDGLCDFWLNSEIKILPDYTAGKHTIELGWEWILMEYRDGKVGNVDLDEVYLNESIYILSFWSNGPIDLTSRRWEFQKLKKDFPQNIDDSDISRGLYRVILSELAFQGFLSKIDYHLQVQGLPSVQKRGGEKIYFKEYKVDPTEN